MNEILEKASTETLYDSIKWVLFLFLAVTWLGETPQAIFSRWPWLIPFVLVLFVVNIFREKSLEKGRKGSIIYKSSHNSH